MSNNEEEKPETSSLTERAGYIVTALSGLFVVLIIGVLAWHIHLIHSGEDYVQFEDQEYKFACSTSECENERSLIQLEKRILSDRNERVKISLASRLMIFVVAEIVALSLVVIGGSLIFNRIESDGEKAELKRETDETKWSFFLDTSFPGVLLCLFGTGALIVAMWFPTSKSAKTEVRDLPVFISDKNFIRNYHTKQFAGTDRGGEEEDGTVSSTGTGSNVTERNLTFTQNSDKALSTETNKKNSQKEDKQ